MGRKKKVYPDITLTGIADKGMAIGRDEDGVVYFVQSGVPGDIVDVLVTRKKASYRKGFVHQYKKYSDERVEPFCDHFGNCGGCKWQYLNYTSQLKYKHKIVEDAMSRIGGIAEIPTLPILGCEKDTLYRNKMEYTFSTRRWVSQEELDTKEEINFGPALGFFKAGHFDKIVPIKKCHLQLDLGNIIRNFVNDYAFKNEISFYSIREHHGILRNLRIRNTTLGEWMVVVVFAEDQPDTINSLLTAVKENFPQITSLQYIINKKLNDSIFDQEVIPFNGQTYITEALGHIQYRISPKSFFQTNTKQANLLYDQIVELANFTGDELVYDLYTGLGSIALYIANKVKKVIGIEEVPEAIKDANLNKTLNQIDNVEFEVGDVKDQLNQHFVGKYGLPDVVIVDPPRAGLHPKVVETINQIDCKRLIYVSCNPSTQARDLSLMKDYFIPEVIQPVDMFPHTHHVENIVALRRK